MRPPEPDRRAALAGLGLLTLTACTGGHTPAAQAPSPSPSPSPSGSPSSGPEPSGDLGAVTLAASLEVGTVQAYEQVLRAAGDGSLGAVAPVVSTVLETVRAHHRQHLDAWTGYLGENHRPTSVEPPDVAQLRTVTSRLARARDVGTALTALLLLERSMAATYVALTADLTSPAGLQTALAVAPVEAAHSSVLALLLDRAPAPHPLLDLSSRVDLPGLSG